MDQTALEYCGDRRGAKAGRITAYGAAAAIGMWGTPISSRVPRRFTALGAAALIAVLGAMGLMLGGYPAKAAARDASTPIPLDCDRACLRNLVDEYLAAVVAHDPSRLPLSEDVIYTENDQVLDVGDGFWNTVTGRGSYSHYFADPVMEEAGWMGTMTEKGGSLLMTLRLRVQLGRITEIETSYFRKGGGGPNDIAGLDAKSSPGPLWLASVPQAQRASRSELIAVANAYFEGIQRDDGKGYYPMTDDCDRIENGAETTNHPTGPTTPGGFNYMGLSCKAQLESGYLGIVTNIHDRRFPLVDLERGVVWAYAVFDMGGTVKTIKLANGETADMSAFAGRASSIEATEAFKIENGKIRRVEMIGSSAPYHLNPAWPGGLSGR
ncbi:MAG TPA: hypothetical protein VFY39_14260 [Gammaproteobacteria bacterium]|nr:hypothetical protein [Gammaproteobacteria bacterium]